MCVYLDLICWALCGIGALLCVCLFYLNGWDIEKTMFGGDENGKN